MKTRSAVVLSVVLVAGVVAASQLGAQTPATPTAAPTTPGIATIQSIVEITRAVPAGSEAVDAFTVPAGVTLVVTDIVVTNTGTSAACGGAVNRAGVSTPTAPSPTTPPTTTAPSVATPPPATTDPGAGTTTGTNPAGTPSTGTTSGPATISGTVTQTDSTVTGPLCVPPQSTTILPLTTGIEFAAGQVVQLLNVPSATAPTATAPGALAFHLRGLLVPLT